MVGDDMWVGGAGIQEPVCVKTDRRSYTHVDSQKGVCAWTRYVSVVRRMRRLAVPQP